MLTFRFGLFVRLRFLFEPITFYNSSEMHANRIQFNQVGRDILERLMPLDLMKHEKKSSKAMDRISHFS